MVEVRWEDDRRIKASLDHAKAVIQAPPLQDIADYYLQVIDDRFDREVDPDGARWEPLAPSTVRQKLRSKYRSKGILERTGAMRRGITAKVRGQDRLEIYSDQDYAQYHELGKAKRRFLTPSKENEKEFGAIVVKAILKGM